MLADLLLHVTEACTCPVNSVMTHSLHFAVNIVLKIFAALSKYTYKDIYKYFAVYIAIIVAYFLLRHTVHIDSFFIYGRPME